MQVGKWTNHKDRHHGKEELSIADERHNGRYKAVGTGGNGCGTARVNSSRSDRGNESQSGG